MKNLVIAVIARDRRGQKNQFALHSKH